MGLVRTLYEVLHEVIFASLKKWLCQGWNTCKIDKEPVPRLKAKEIGEEISLSLSSDLRGVHPHASVERWWTGRYKKEDCGLRTTDCTQSAGYKTRTRYKMRTRDYNPGQNYLRKFSPSCPLSYATKLFPKRRLCGKKTPSPNSMLLPTNVQGSGFLLNTQQHCFQGKGEREEPVQLRKCCPSIQFFQQFCPRLYGLDWV